MISKVRTLLIIMFSVVVAMVLIAPFTEPFGSVTGLDGSIGMIDHNGLWSQLGVFADITYTAGDIVCHQQMARSFMLNGSQLALCSRDLSILVGILAGLVMFRIRPELAIDKRAWSVMLFFFVLLFLEWTIGSAMDANVTFTRVISGFLGGVGIAILVEKMMFKLVDDVIGGKEKG